MILIKLHINIFDSISFQYFYDSSLHIACQEGFADIVKLLLLQKNIIIDMINYVAFDFKLESSFEHL